jgi:peptidoglycan biosynthesis protein MviN/MurJ (putative lipid II flippase)
MAGISSAMRVGLPILVSTLAAATVLLVRHAAQMGTSTTGAALRSAIGACLIVFLVAYWVRRRDSWRRKFRQFMADGQAHTKQQRSTPA